MTTYPFTIQAKAQALQSQGHTCHACGIKLTWGVLEFFGGGADGGAPGQLRDNSSCEALCRHCHCRKAGAARSRKVGKEKSWDAEGCWCSW
mmetsp:Transcript_34921/g.115751  ORF Transcript_34921/g.115751 Transcript_34921/m.115751 type:complete len:91 (-) Transcript_34921:224-496(-)